MEFELINIYYLKNKILTTFFCLFEPYSRNLNAKCAFIATKFLLRLIKLYENDLEASNLLDFKEAQSNKLLVSLRKKSAYLNEQVSRLIAILRSIFISNNYTNNSSENHDRNLKLQNLSLNSSYDNISLLNLLRFDASNENNLFALLFTLLNDAFLRTKLIVATNLDQSSIKDDDHLKLLHRVNLEKEIDNIKNIDDDDEESDLNDKSHLDDSQKRKKSAEEESDDCLLIGSWFEEDQTPCVISNKATNNNEVKNNESLLNTTFELDSSSSIFKVRQSLN
jgi:hypothetical protein